MKIRNETDAPAPASGGAKSAAQLQDELDQLANQYGDLLDENDRLKAALAASPQPAEDKLRDAISLILPLAKGYAAAHPVGSNQAYVDYVESFVSNEGDAISRPAAPSGGEKRAAIMREVKSYAACDDVGSAQWINALTSRLVEVTK